MTRTIPASKIRRRDRVEIDGISFVVMESPRRIDNTRIMLVVRHRTRKVRVVLTPVEIVTVLR